MLGPLWEGTLGEGRVTCPWHRWTYDLRTGQCVDSPQQEGQDSRLRRLQTSLTPQGTLAVAPPDDTFSNKAVRPLPDLGYHGARENLAMKTLDNILHSVGQTPLVRLQRLGKETGCEFLVKVRVHEPRWFRERPHRQAHGGRGRKERPHQAGRPP